MEQQGWNDRANKILGTVKVFAKWLLLASVVGVVVGLMGVLFHVTVEKATELRMTLPWLLYLLPLGGVAIVLLYQKSGMEKDMGTNTIIQAVRGENPLRFRTAPLIFISTVLTHLLGGSSGREGAALQIGGSVGARLADGFSLNQQDHQIMIMCGMSTCFAALFGTPLTATIFAIEVISVGVMHYSALVPCLTGSLIGYGIASSFGIAPTAFDIGTIPALGPVTVIQVILLSVLCAVVSALFCMAMHHAGHLYKKCFSNPILRAAVGGILVILLTLLVGTRDYNGAGMDVINRAVSGQAEWYAFFLKILFTALTLGAGFKGGEIVPTFFVGATFGCAAGPLLGLDPSFSAGIGMIALFCGVINCPVASFVLAVELFGGEGVIFFGIASAIAYMMSGYYGLYSSQKIVFSKLENKRIDVNSH